LYGFLEKNLGCNVGVSWERSRENAIGGIEKSPGVVPTLISGRIHSRSVEGKVLESNRGKERLGGFQGKLEIHDKKARKISVRETCSYTIKGERGREEM